MLTLLFTSLAMCATLAGGYVAVAARHRRLHLLMGLGAGVLLGAVFFDLLPEAHRRSPSLTVSVAALAGIAFIAVAVQVIGK